MFRSKNNINVIQREKSNNREKSPLSFEEKIKKEFKKSGFDPEKGFKLHQLASKDPHIRNPMGWTIAAFKNEYAEERLNLFLKHDPETIRREYKQKLTQAYIPQGIRFEVEKEGICYGRWDHPIVKFLPFTEANFQEKADQLLSKLGGRV